MYGFNLNEMNYTVYNLRGVGLCMASRACLDAMISLKLTTYECGISKTDVQSDVTLFSKCVVDEKLWKKPEVLRQDLATQMAQKSEGMFLWVKLQERSLRNSRNGVHLRKIVNDMPVGLGRLRSGLGKDIEATKT